MERRLKPMFACQCVYRQRRSFTLLEMLLVIFLMSLFLGVIGINVNKAVHEQRFRAEVGMVVDTLRIAQNIMLILDNDVHVKFKKEENAISIHLETACPLSKRWGKLLTKPRYLRTIHIVQLTNQPVGSLDLRFLSTGYVMSQGVMRLATAEASNSLKGLEAFICLPGYPSTIVSTEQRPSEQECRSLAGEAFVENLTNQTVSEIKSLQAARKSARGNEPTQRTGGDGTQEAQ